MNSYETRPRTVTLACATSLAISVWDVVSTVSDAELIEMSAFMALILAFSAIPVIFTVAAFLRRNWGRIVLAVISVLGALSFPLLMFFERDIVAADTMASIVESVLYAIAEVVVVVLLYLPASNAWFRGAHADY